MPRLLTIALLLLATLPRVSLAAPTGLAGDTPARRPPRLLSTDPGAPGSGLTDKEPEGRKEPEGQGGGRVAAGLGLGVLMGAVGGLVGYLGPGSALCAEGDGLDGCATGLLIGTLGGVGLGTSLGVTWGGMLADGQGEWFLGALPGMLVGAAAGVGLGLAADNSLVALFACPPLMLLGSSIGYEMSHSANTAPRLRPVVGMSSRGASLGLAGTF
ncbi:hypothetical protein [Melittangium boletus]|uniref:Uncharacterized protein n=1 Tax=Melittangium boletus DSM 14713 TaxID=1294270 RepID=A0A250IBK0_9BACT|nr:hypothetical protein [Melittangium boletus]ATB29234.1 hypothetical protein MEBOL_002683 [Melittangium boletus DSM 14713]